MLRDIRLRLSGSAVGIRPVLAVRKKHVCCYERKVIAMKNKKYWIKFLGLAAALIGSGAALVTDMIDRYETSELIDEKIEKAFAEHEKNKEEEES